MKSRLIAGVAGASAVAALSIFVMAGPAQASEAQCGSNNNRACAWIDANFAGAFGYWTSSHSSLPGFHDNISSDANTRTAYIGWFSDTGYSGNLFEVAPNGGGYFQWPDPRNDSFDSVYFY
jgi:hypothetical protein